MPRTQGEVLESSWRSLFQFCLPEQRCAFVDIGSGYGTLVRESVGTYGCIFGLGVEKYREPVDICSERQAKASQVVQDNTKFVLADINDVDILELLSERTFEVLVLFCNNLAFNIGTNARFSKKLKELFVALPSHAVYAITAIPSPELQRWKHSTLLLDMSWTKEGPHESCVYCKPSSNTEA